jgi:hypothetical protein
MFRRWDARTTEKRRRTERALRAVLLGPAPYARALDELHTGAGGAGAGGDGGASAERVRLQSTAFLSKVALGLGRTVASQYRSSTLYQTY